MWSHWKVPFTKGYKIIQMYVIGFVVIWSGTKWSLEAASTVFGFYVAVWMFLNDTKFYQLVFVIFFLLQLDKIGKASANGSVPKSGKPNEKVTEKTSDDRLAR